MVKMSSSHPWFKIVSQIDVELLLMVVLCLPPSSMKMLLDDGSFSRGHLSLMLALSPLPIDAIIFKA